MVKNKNNSSNSLAFGRRQKRKKRPFHLNVVFSHEQKRSNFVETRRAAWTRWTGLTGERSSRPRIGALFDSLCHRRSWPSPRKPTFLSKLRWEQGKVSLFCLNLWACFPNNLRVFSFRVLKVRLEKFWYAVRKHIQRLCFEKSLDDSSLKWYLIVSSHQDVYERFFYSKRKWIIQKLDNDNILFKNASL